MSNPFVIGIEMPSRLKVAATPNEDSECQNDPDDVRDILGAACSALASETDVKFVVQFAGESWPTDVRTDLSTVLEQVSGVGKGLVEPFEIDFYEQGLERTLSFRPRNGEIEVSCTSRHLTWKAPDMSLRVSREFLRSSLARLVNQFVELVSAVRPGIVKHPLFLSWYRKVSAI